MVLLLCIEKTKQNVLEVSTNLPKTCTKALTINTSSGQQGSIKMGRCMALLMTEAPRPNPI